MSEHGDGEKEERGEESRSGWRKPPGPCLRGIGTWKLPGFPYRFFPFSHWKMGQILRYSLPPSLLLSLPEFIGILGVVAMFQ